MTDQPPEGQEPRGPVQPPGPQQGPTPPGPTPPGPTPPGQPPVQGQPPQPWQQPGGQHPQPPPQAWPQQGQPPPYGQLPPGQPHPGQPPYGQPAHGPYGATYAQRPPAPGLPTWAKIVLGALIGLLVSVGSPLLAFALAGVDAPVELLVLLVTIIPVLLASPLLIARQTRSWGIGIMLGLAVGSFVLGGACVSLVAGY